MATAEEATASTVAWTASESVARILAFQAEYELRSQLFEWKFTRPAREESQLSRG